jgi:hypothetical protein
VVDIRQRAYFTFRAPDADFDPAFITDLLGIIPTEAHRRGDMQPHGRPARSSAWDLAGSYTADYDTESLVITLLDIFEPVAHHVHEVQRHFDIQAGVQVVVHMYGEIMMESGGEADFGITTPATRFSASTIGRLAGLGAWLDIDQYVYAGENDGMGEYSPLAIKL